MSRPLAVILAGGIGKNFYPFVTNKTLFQFLGKPLLQHVIEDLEWAGFSDALVVTNAENEKWFHSYQPFNITLQTVFQDTPNGMAGALLAANSYIKDRPILIINAVDVIERPFYKAVLQQINKGKPFVTARKTRSYFPGGYVQLMGDKATGIIEKPPQGDEPSDLIKLVMDYFPSPSLLLSSLGALTESDDRYEKAITNIMSQEPINVLQYDGIWKKLKYPHHVLDVMNALFQTRLINNRSMQAQISKHANIEGTVYISEGAKIFPFASIKGPVFIGKNAIVGDHTLVRESVIENNAVVGFGSEVSRSYIGPGCELHHNFIGDSILEENVNPSWGTTTANFRLDKKAVKVKLPNGNYLETDREKLGALIAKGAFLGVNSSIMPGVALEENYRCLPNSLVK